VHGPKIFKTKTIKSEAAKRVESLLEIVKNPPASGEEVCVRYLLAEA
jgi:hypothetical protein